MRSALRGEALLSTAAGLVFDFASMPRSKWAQSTSAWLEYWRGGRDANTVKLQHRQAAFGWIALAIIGILVGSGSAYVVEFLLGAKAAAGYEASGVPALVVMAPILLCAYHWIASIFAADSEPGALGRWSISWLTDAAWILVAYAVTL